MLHTQDPAIETHKNSLDFIQTTYKLFCVVYSRVLKYITLGMMQCMHMNCTRNIDYT